MSQQGNKAAAIAHNKAEVERLATDISNGLLKNIRDQFVFQDINFTGDLSASFETIKQEDGFHAVVTKNSYAVPVDVGMPAGTEVNFDALYNWVVGKLGIEEGDTAREVTFKIRQKILAKGIKPKRYMKKAIKKFIGQHGGRVVGKPSSSASKRSGGILKLIRKVNRKLKKVDKVLKQVGKIRKGKI